MTLRVMVFEKHEEDLAIFETAFKSKGCKYCIFRDSEIDEEKKQEIDRLRPQLAIVSSCFEDQLDGLSIVQKLHECYPDIVVIICSSLLDDPGSRDSVAKKYRACPNVDDVVGKKAFPTFWEEYLVQ